MKKKMTVALHTDVLKRLGELAVKKGLTRVGVIRQLILDEHNKMKLMESVGR